MAQTNPFQQATRKARRAKISITGVPGSGKTYTAFQIARGLIGPGGKLAVVDTENGATSDYAGEFAFDDLIVNPPFTAAKFVQAFQRAEQFGYDCLLVDGISPFWESEGGILDVADENQQAAGGWAKARPLAFAMDQAILRAPMHVIVTVRSKADTKIEPGPGGKMRPVTIGVKPSMSKDTAFVLNFMFYVDHDTHALSTTKTRWRAIDGQNLAPNLELAEGEVSPAEEMGQLMAVWLAEGVEAPVTPAPAEQPATEAQAPAPTPAPQTAAQAQPERDVPFVPAGADDDLLAAAKAAFAEPVTPPASIASAEAVAKIGQLVAEMKYLAPTLDVETRVKGWVPGKEYAQYTADEAATTTSRLEQTILKMKEPQNG